MDLGEFQQRSHQLLFERRSTYRLLMICAGMMGAYTFVLRGGAFCNAQTANIALMAIALGQGRWIDGLYFLVPLTAYFLGAFLSELFLDPLKQIGPFRWDTWLIAIEALVLFGIGFIPLTVPHQVVQILINFLASMQYNTFRRVDGIPMATTFCTNHIRQVGIGAAKAVRGTDPEAKQRAGAHLKMLIAFLLGGILVGAACQSMQERAIWLALIPLLIILTILVQNDWKRRQTET